MKKMLIVDFVLLILFFIAWCVLDYILVHSPEYPSNIQSADWTFIFVPIVTLACNLWRTRQLSRTRMILYSLLGTLGMCLALALVIVAFGIPFNFQIGGQQ